MPKAEPRRFDWRLPALAAVALLAILLAARGLNRNTQPTSRDLPEVPAGDTPRTADVDMPPRGNP